MPEFTQTDWYRFPLYYDIVFDPDTGHEADFLEGVLHRHGVIEPGKPARILEPACGNGRLVVELARRGHRVTGFDLSPEMLAFARQRLRAEAADVRARVRLRKARMESFRIAGPFDLSFCLLSTFKYLLTEAHALAHLRRTAAVLARGGLVVLGIHLTDYERRRTDREVWRGSRDGISVLSVTVTEPADPASRREWLRNRLRVRRRGVSEDERLETRWQCRTYDAAEFEALIARVPALDLVACYDFTHRLDHPRVLDDSQEDVVVVLRKR